MVKVYIIYYDDDLWSIISSKLPSDRPNNDRRSQELRTFLYDVTDLWLETVTKFFPRTMFDRLSWKF
jgi:hypothetical protein